MKNGIPFRFDYQEPSKLSRPNLESLFSTLQHLVSLEAPAYAGPLRGLLGQIFNEMGILYGLSPLDFISEVKLVRRWLVEFVRGGDISQGSLDDARWNFTAGSPELLGDFIQVYNDLHMKAGEASSTLFIRILYTMLCADRVIVLNRDPDFSTITKAPSYDTESEAYPKCSEITEALQTLGFDPATFKATYREYTRNFKYEILSSKGPNGAQTWSAHLDAHKWARSELLLPKFQAFLEESGLSSILKDLLGLIGQSVTEILPKEGLRLGKLNVIQEWGGKARIVASLDYWTQMALTPLHNCVNHFLRQLPTDGTFDQDAIAARVKSWTSVPSMEINSLDLKAATDLLPIYFQKQILSILLNSASFANNWASILVDRNYCKPDGSDIMYRTGQPMGARSSFPMLALTHHVIVMIAAKRAGVTLYSDYVILGDDIVMTNHLVAQQYKLIMKSLGVEIQLEKSVLHREGALPSAEICKRVFVNGSEISMFNAKQLVKTSRDGTLAPTLQNSLLRSGWEPSSQVFWTFLAGLIDRENLITLIRLNVMPTEITGLVRTITPNTGITNLSSWFEGITLTRQDLIELHTYVVATDQLKRLDAVLKAGAAMRNSIMVIAGDSGMRDEDLVSSRDIWLREFLNDKQRAVMDAILKSHPNLTYNHPIVRAAIQETNRISSLLHTLNSFDEKMVIAARHGLLEACRTNLTGVWDVDRVEPVQISRAIVLRMITVLMSLVSKYYANPNSKSALSVTYSVTLTSLGRLWNVFFKLGGRMSVNALRASVARSVVEATTTLASAEKGSSFELPNSPSNIPRDVGVQPSQSIARQPRGEGSV